MNEFQMDEQLKHSVNEQRMKLAGLELPPNTDSATREKIKEAVAESFVFGYRVIMFTSAVLALASGGSSWLLIGKSGLAKSQEHGD
jgi:ABC-type phosphate transport system auxiliary subunit